MRSSVLKWGWFTLLLLAAIILAPAVIPYPAEAQTEFIGRSEIMHMKWGGSQGGWGKINSLENLRIERGTLGSVSIVLGDNSPIPDQSTDLLLSFDGSKNEFTGGHTQPYAVEEVNIVSSSDIKMFGDGAAGFLHHSNLVSLKPLPGSVFLDDPLGSFTIDFYLFPHSVREEKTVFSWYAPAIDTGGFSGVRAYLKEERLFWEFEKVFFRRVSKEWVNIIAREFHPTTLGEWHHHAIHYDAATGLLSLYLDGEESALAWLTEDGTEYGSLLSGRFSQYLKAPIIIGEQYLGFLDEFRISRGLPIFYLGRYRDQGKLRSDVIALPSMGTKLVSITWDGDERNGTAIRVYCRFSESPFLPGELDEENDRENPPWLQVYNGVLIERGSVKGKYMQWRAELFGTENRYTPRLLSIDIALELDPPPEAPTLVDTVPTDGGILLRWIKNKESDIKGYKVYYGASSRFYFGKGSNAGDSPVWVGDVSSYELTGLENEQVYFLSITAVDDEDQESGFSQEYIARPSRIYKE